MGKHKIKCGSKYFDTKYGNDAAILIECEIDFRKEATPASFLYLGRCLAEGRPELFEGKMYYGKIKGLGEIIHESELGEEVS